ncbi:MAG: WYL domain-containing protein [Bacteroidia bacterium]|nr:MAG: WYL domain-containing protein [Bacteroidia bacterium]
MPINKNAMIRYQTLDKCFRNPGRMYFIEDLLQECNNALQEYDPNSEGIQKRQLFEDIKFMESEQGWSIPLERYRYGKKVYYRYTDLNFSINHQNVINITELEQIKSALEILQNIDGKPQIEWINNILAKLETYWQHRNLRSSKIISYDTNKDLVGLEHFTPLFNAIVNKRVLKILYRGFKKSEKYQLIFHPYHLKEYNKRWFVIGFHEEKNISNWVLALDRIQALEETDKNYILNFTDWEEYFYDIIGVTKPYGAEPQEIHLVFSSEIAPYIMTKPLHPTQKHKILPQNAGLEVKIEVVPNYELESLILSYGEKIKVIEPLDLKEKIQARLKNCLDLYGEN